MTVHRTPRNKILTFQQRYFPHTDPPYSLWVQLVDGPIDPDRDLQDVLAAPLPHLVEDPGEPRAAHVGRASRNTLTDQPHDVAVQLRGKNTQRGENVVDLFSIPGVTEKYKQ